MKKLLVLLLCVCIVISCTACVKVEDGDKPVTVEATEMPGMVKIEVTAEPTEEAVAEPTEEPVAEATDEPETEVLPESTQDVFVEGNAPVEGSVDEEEEIVVEELMEVDDLMLNASLSDEEWVNILLLGGDSRDKGDYGRTDSIIVLSVNQGEGKVKMTSLMRDMWVPIYGKGSAKINAANVYGGPDLAMRTVNENFDMNISKYVLVNMQSLAGIIDALGGVVVEEVTESERVALNEQLEKDMDDFDVVDASPLLESGYNIRLTGNQALAFSRIRYLDSDYKRVDRQREVLMGMAYGLKDMGAGTAVALIPTLLESVETNLGMGELMSLAGVALNMDLSTIEQMRLPAEGTYESGTMNGVWKIIANMDKNAKILHDFIYGEDAAE